jgi:hypothetical protein
MQWTSTEKQERPKDFLKQRDYLKLVIQEHQIKPMHRYVKKVDEAKTKLDEAKTKFLHETHEDTREREESFEMQLLQFLQRPTIKIDLDISISADSGFALHFGSVKDIGVEVRN